MTKASLLNRHPYLAVVGYAVIAAGCLALAGWQFDITVLKSLLINAAPINPVTATTLLLCGVWMVQAQRAKVPRWLPLLPAFVLAVGIVHFVTYFYPAPGIRIDYLLFSARTRHASTSNLIAPNTALVFITCSIAMLTVGVQQRWLQLVRHFLILNGFLMAYVSVLGYIYNIEPAYRFGGYAPMALLTALIFLVFHSGLFFSNTNYGIPKMFASSLDGSRLLRLMTIIVILVPPIAGYLRLLGERRGLYPIEFGVELHTLIFSAVVFILVILYAAAENRKQIMQTRAERELAASEHRFRTLVGSLKEGVAAIGYDGKIQYCNPSYCHIIGYNEEELVGKKVVDMIIPVSLRPEFYSRLESRKSGVEEDYETEIIRKNGEKIWIDIKSRTLVNEHGSSYAYIVSINDITQQKRNLEDMEAFTGSAAHDLNSPISKIIMLTDIFETENLDDEQKDLLSMMGEVAHGMFQLLKDLLAYSRVGAAAVERADVDVDKIAREVSADLQPKDFSGTLTLQQLPPAKRKRRRHQAVVYQPVFQRL